MGDICDLATLRTAVRDTLAVEEWLAGEGRALADELHGIIGGPADPALDLGAAWHLLDHEPRRVFRTQLDPPELDWQRGRAWAFEQAMGLVWYYATSNPTMSELGRRTLKRLSEDEPADRR